MLGFRDSPARKPHPNDSQTLRRPFQSGTSSFEFGTRDTRAIISEGPAPEQAAISCINSTNSCNFCLLVDFLHHPTFPPRRKLRGFFLSHENRAGSASNPINRANIVAGCIRQQQRPNYEFAMHTRLTSIIETPHDWSRDARIEYLDFTPNENASMDAVLRQGRARP